LSKVGDKRKSGSLVSPESLGGIIAGKGFDFQARYAACHLPLWLQEPSFHQLFFEGTGDIDIRLAKGDASTRAMEIARAIVPTPPLQDDPR